MGQRIYLDFNASTPLAAEVVEAMRLFLTEQGFRRITVLDIAGAALEYAKQRLGPRAAMVSWVIADITAWTPTETYDVWHDRATFHFLVRAEERDAYRNVLLAALRPGGHAIIGTFASDGPERCSGLPVVRYEPATLALELGPRFRLVEAVREQHVTPEKTVQAFQFSRFVRIG
jgi:SAM-dependent methyltransferase